VNYKFNQPKNQQQRELVETYNSRVKQFKLTEKHYKKANEALSRTVQKLVSEGLFVKVEEAPMHTSETHSE
jgi:DNA-binding transcriptional regulator GbsR (MarR family)